MTGGPLINPHPCAEAVALAAEQMGRYGDMALGRTRMQLYSALHDRVPAQVDLLAQTCHVLMEQDRLRDRLG